MQFWCARNLHPSLKAKTRTKTKHHHSINEISRSPPFSLPVLFVIYVFKTVWVFIMLICLFCPSFLGLQKNVSSVRLSFFLPRAGIPVFGLRGGRRAGPGWLWCGVGVATATGTVAVVTAAAEAAAFVSLWSWPSLHTRLQPVVRRRRVGAHGAHLRVHVVRRLLLDPRRRHALLLLAPVAEPDADHFLLHVQLLCDQQDLL